jgi:selenocysteine-specific elongation factor
MAKAGIPMQPSRIASVLGCGEDDARELTRVMMDAGELLLLSEDFYFHAGVADALAKRLTDWLNDYLDRRPLRFGAQKKEAAQVLFPEMEQKEQRVFFQYLEDAGLFEQNETLIRPAGRADAIGEKHGAMIDAVRALYNESPFSPPPWAEASAAAGIPPADRDEIFQWFIRGGEWVRLSDEAVITQYGINEAEKLLRAASPDGSFTLAEARDLLGTTRKWAQLLGEYFDQTKATTWDGERRYWKS